MKDEFPNIIKLSNRTPHKLETDRGGEFHNSIFKNYFELNKINTILVIVIKEQFS